MSNNFDLPATYRLHLPARYSVVTKIAGNPVRQLLRPEEYGPMVIRPYRAGKVQGVVVTRKAGGEVLVVDCKVAPDAFPNGDILRIPKSTLADPRAVLEDPEAKKTWCDAAALAAATIRPEDATLHATAVRASWQSQFTYRVENPATAEKGLRLPQDGALHAVLAHWSVSPAEPGTVVMPTGTGKTETMVAVQVNQRLPLVLVTVPTSALREQIGRKFMTLGVLRDALVIGNDALYPVVGLIEHQLKTVEDAEQLLRSCNTIVATMQAITGCSEEVRRKISELCDCLMIDEAHHVRADSWDSFRRRFHGKRILQFTATPFREDKKHVGGKMIFSYPLWKAQEEGYFQKINFRSVYTHGDGDRLIAEAAIEQLKTDLQQGLDHLVMARVDTIERAAEVIELYRKLAPDFGPLIVHSQMSEKERRDALTSLRAHGTRVRDARIVVCVNMLGEGFDLPQLKIAALHDVHKSLAVTLQFTGRFTRTLEGVGEATMIANRADADVQKQLRALYADNADWNRVIRDLGTDRTAEEREHSAFKEAFTSIPEEVPFDNVLPKMSTVVYRTDCSEWNPHALTALFPEDERLTKEIGLSEELKVAWLISRETGEVQWGEFREVENVAYHLYLIHWDEKQSLLFINSSNKDSLHESLAKVVAGESAKIIDGTDVYRALHNILRMVPTNMGVKEVVSRTRRFMMLVGADVTEGLDPAQTLSKTKTNLFGYGFEDGERVSVGCSLKGRVWSYLIASGIPQWVSWCRHVGAKLIDENISTDAVFHNFIRPVRVENRPSDLVPLGIQWPIEFFREQEQRITVEVPGSGETVPFFDVELDILEHSKNGPVRFCVSTRGGVSTNYRVSFGADGTRYLPEGEEAQITIGRRVKPLSEWFRQFSPKLHFENDTFIEDDMLLRLDRTIPPYDPARIEAWEWKGIDLTKESQGAARAEDSVQRRVIRRLLEPGQDWDIIFDDDDAGEVADVVAIRMESERLLIHLYHCKFSGEEKAGCRVDDFYAVCGQAQKSVRWRESTGLAALIPHLVARDQKRAQRGEDTRFDKGDLACLDEIAQRMEVLRPEFRVFVVQPGLSKARVATLTDATRPVLELLAATSLYLRETFNIDFGVIANR